MPPVSGTTPAARTSAGAAFTAAALRRRLGRWLVDSLTPPARTTRDGVAMFHFGRCGSSVLAGMLARTPGLHWDHEVFAGHALLARAHARGDDTAWSRSRHFPLAPLPYLRRRMRWAGRARYGFETKFHHVRANGLTLEGYLAALRALGFTRFVLLRRRNLLRVVLSSLRAVEDGPHLRAGTAAQARPVEVDVHAVRISGQCLGLTALFEQWEQDCAELRARLAPSELLELVYEEDVATDPGVAYRRICTFAGLPAQAVAPTQARTNPFPVAQMLGNPAQVHLALAGTPWAWMLDAD